MKMKQDGSVLLPTLIISGMILALALSLTKIVSNELQFSADLLLGERAYFAAESGVEQALLSLKDEPINLIERTTKLSKGSETTVTTFNKLEEFDFEIEASETLRWRLGRDLDPGFGVTRNMVRDLQISGQNLADNMQWKIQCAGSTLASSLQRRAISNLITPIASGVWDEDGDIGETTIESFLASIDDETICYISLTNFGKDIISGRVYAPRKMAPAQTKVRALGYAGGREKVIEFEYRQKNLAPFFDFGLLHSE